MDTQSFWRGVFETAIIMGCFMVFGSAWVAVETAAELLLGP